MRRLRMTRCERDSSRPLPDQVGPGRSRSSSSHRSSSASKRTPADLRGLGGGGGSSTGSRNDVPPGGGGGTPNSSVPRREAVFPEKSDISGPSLRAAIDASIREAARWHETTARPPLSEHRRP